MTFKIRMPISVYRYAKERAGGTDQLLRLKIEEYVVNYSNGGTAQQRGGRVTADRMTPEERSEKMRTAVNARWAKRDAEQAPEPDETPDKI